MIFHASLFLLCIFELFWLVFELITSIPTCWGHFVTPFAEGKNLCFACGCLTRQSWHRFSPVPGQVVFCHVSVLTCYATLGGGILLDRLACTGRGCHLFCILLLIVDACQPAHSRDRKRHHKRWWSISKLSFRSFAASFSASGVLHIQKGEQVLCLARRTDLWHWSII